MSHPLWQPRVLQRAKSPCPGSAPAAAKSQVMQTLSRPRSPGTRTGGPRSSASVQKGWAGWGGRGLVRGVLVVSHLSSHWEPDLGFSTDSLPGTGKGLHPWPHLPPPPVQQAEYCSPPETLRAPREGAVCSMCTWLSPSGRGRRLHKGRHRCLAVQGQPWKGPLPLTMEPSLVFRHMCQVLWQIPLFQERTNFLLTDWPLPTSLASPPHLHSTP